MLLISVFEVYRTNEVGVAPPGGSSPSWLAKGDASTIIKLTQHEALLSVLLSLQVCTAVS